MQFCCGMTDVQLNSLHNSIDVYRQFHYSSGSTAAAFPSPLRLGDPALCGSRPLVTPYYCRLGDLLCCVFVQLLYFSVICVFFVPSVL